MKEMKTIVLSDLSDEQQKDMDTINKGLYETYKLVDNTEVKGSSNLHNLWSAMANINIVTKVLYEMFEEEEETPKEE